MSSAGVGGPVTMAGRSDAALGPWARLGRLWRTVRWLRREQWLGRAQLLWRRYGLRPRPDPSAAPALRPWPGPWVVPAARAASLVGPSRFRLLDQEYDLDAIGWDNPELPLLWRYNQHYFDDLNAEGASSRGDWHAALLRRWLAENPPAAGTGWAPYPSSLRIVNWIKWRRSATPCHGPVDMDHSLAIQVRWLARSIEWHLLGNHLFANAKALIFAGCHFQGPEAGKWLRRGIEIVSHELTEQILADGGHFERSPMYHLQALEDLLDLIDVLRASAPADPEACELLGQLLNRAQAMRCWLAAMQHADGTLVRFNDTAEGVAPPTFELERMAKALGLSATPPVCEENGLRDLQPSGYVRWARGPAVAWLDLAPVGPDYLPGHAHADTLSFELAVQGHPLVVNRGTSVYGDGPRRQWERGTAAHSTVQIGNRNSSEVWAGFRVGRRARVRRVRVDERQLTAAHDGYAHLPGAPVHERTWLMDDNGLTVTDQVVGVPAEAAVARFHLAPGLALGPAGGSGRPILGADGQQRAMVECDTGRPRESRTEHAVRFGRTEPATTLEVELVDGRSSVRFVYRSH